MKNEIINIRITSSFKEDLGILAQLKGLSISDLGREALNMYFNTTDFGEPEVRDTIEEKHNKDSDGLLQSLAFTELIFWIYDKRLNPEMSEIDQYYDQHVALIDEMNNHSRFTSEILIEFNKIKSELKGECDGYDHRSGIFLFSQKNNPNSFNYDKLSYFMYGIRYTENQVKDLFIK